MIRYTLHFIRDKFNRNRGAYIYVCVHIRQILLNYSNVEPSSRKIHQIDTGTSNIQVLFHKILLDRPSVKSDLSLCFV